MTNTRNSPSAARRAVRSRSFLLAAAAAFAALTVAGAAARAEGPAPATAAAGPSEAEASPSSTVRAPAEAQGRVQARRDRERARRDGNRDRRRARVERRFRDRRGANGYSGGRALLSPRLAEELELTEAQRDGLRTLFRDLADERRDGRRALADARRELSRAVGDENRSPDEVKELGAAVGVLEAEQALRRRTDRERMRALLTEEQRSKLAERNERRGRRGSGR